jgi:hypothetical protein
MKYASARKPKNAALATVALVIFNFIGFSPQIILPVASSKKRQISNL